MPYAENTNINNHYPFSPVPFRYSYNAFEPYMSGDTVQHHYDNVYLGYINNLNRLLEPYPQYHGITLGDLIINGENLPSSIRLGVADNAGGVYNHEVIFETLHPYNIPPEGIIAAEIDATFGSYDNMIESAINNASSVTGSGHIIGAKRNNGALVLITSENEETSLPYNLYPLFMVDLWEHAHVKDFVSREDYIRAMFNIINWDAVNSRYSDPFDFEQPLTANN